MRYSIRTLLKSPGFTLIALVTLGLGVGANTAVFTVVNSVLLRPLPYPDPARLVMLWAREPAGGQNAISAPDFQDWREQSRSFEHMAAFTGATFSLADPQRPEKVDGFRVTSEFFPVLGVNPVLGRALLPNGAGEAVVSDSFWKSKLGGSLDVIGSVVKLDREPFTVVGVMPPGFEFFGKQNVIWVPLVFDQARATRNFYYLTSVARLKSDITIQQARAEMDGIAARLASEYPTNRGWGAKVITLRDELVGSVRTALLVLLAAVTFVLLIACANVANLLLVRAAGRQREFAVRAALGAGRQRLIRQLLMESVTLALAGCALGLGLAYFGTQGLLAMHPANLPRIEEIAIDPRVMVFAVVVSLLTGIGFGLAPVWQLRALNLNESLKEGGRSNAGGAGQSRLHSALVVAEMALALVLLTGAGLAIRSFVFLTGSDPGFHAGNLLTASVGVSEQEYASEQQVAGDFARACDRIRSLPGVASVAGATNLPIEGWNQGRVFTIVGRAPASSSELLGAGYVSITPGYFRTAGIPLLKGRDFTERDRHGSPDVVIISASMARRFWPTANPVGRRILCASRQFGKPGLGPPIAREIIGIAGDVNHVGLDAGLSTEMYVPQMQNTIPFTFFLVKTEGDPMRVAEPVRQAVHAVIKDSPVSTPRNAEELLAESFASPRFNMTLLGIFAGVALALAAIGIYGVMAYTVAQRRQEIGIRTALGARRSDVLRMVVGHGLRLAGAGILIGCVLAAAASRLMSSLLYGIKAADWITFAAVSLILLITAVLASYIPAARATAKDPLTALRQP